MSTLELEVCTDETQPASQRQLVGKRRSHARRQIVASCWRQKFLLYVSLLRETSSTLALRVGLPLLRVASSDAPMPPSLIACAAVWAPNSVPASRQGTHSPCRCVSCRYARSCNPQAEQYQFPALESSDLTT
jgi:hypothetical protein